MYVAFVRLLEVPSVGLVDLSYIGHCVAYLRQAIHCAADVTLEGPNRDPVGELRSLRE